MDKPFKKRNFFSGNNMEREGAGFRMSQEFYYEGQSVNDHNVWEEQDIIIMREKRTARFSANYNMFF